MSADRLWPMIGDLDQILKFERDMLVLGRVSEIQQIQGEKQSASEAIFNLLETLKAAGTLPENVSELERVRQRAIENEVIFRAALRGLRQAIGRLTTSQTEVGSYRSDGTGLLFRNSQGGYSEKA